MHIIEFRRCSAVDVLEVFQRKLAFTYTCDAVNNKFFSQVNLEVASFECFEHKSLRNDYIKLYTYNKDTDYAVNFFSN